MPHRDFKTTLATAIGLTALAALALSAGPAGASGDYGLPRVYALIQDTDFENNVPFFAPSNDSRANLMMLLADAGLTRPRLPVSDAAAAPAKPDAYAAQTPLDLDTFAAVFNDKATAADDGSDFADGQGDRCRSNAAGGDAYLAALKASDVPQAEKTLLTDARNALLSSCAAGTRTVLNLQPAAIKSALGKDFATYLFAAADFYYGDFVNARRGFGGLQQSRQAWLKEASHYMVARADINAAQASAFGDYGELTLKAVQAKALTDAGTEFKAYLNDYPRGAYVASARGLLRRVAWLGGDNTQLAEAFGAVFAQPDARLRNVSAVDLAYEADNKLLAGAKPGDIHEPHLLFTYDMMQMRRMDGKPAPLSRADLEAQRPLFAKQPELYDYLLAAYAFYDEDNAAAALKILNAKAAGPHMSFVQFSEQVLKGLALEATHNPAARTQWLNLIPLAEPVVQRPAVELALAENYERAGTLAPVFAAGSPVRDPNYRALLLTYSAGPDLLRQRATANDAADFERRLSLYVLLYKELTRGRYQPFLDDLRLMPANPPKADASESVGIRYEGITPALENFSWPGTGKTDDFACPSIKAIATALAHDAHDERSLICLGEFQRLNNYDNVLRNEPPQPTPANVSKPLPELTGLAPAQFPGIGISRLDIYKTIIADAKAPSDVRAYALYRAVNCWAPSAYNSCDTSDAPQSQRKAWFHELKTRYATTGWAQGLKYYW
ncbi:hypothetical protein [Asticcacaulis solisilvae]|uniref:hypothetical protein n=1 Tax=Asticcacaulis solisilvae TaxID=1217274 RepID=UPI003FD7BC3E